MSLNSVLYNILKPLADNHLMLNDFGAGDLANYAASKAVKYPIMWAVLNNVPFSGNTLSYSFSIVFADMVKDDGSDTIAVQSDMIQIAADIAAALAENEDLEVTSDFLLKPFTERFKD